jgi:hypothetical protein
VKDENGDLLADSHKLSATVEISPISLGWNVVQEQVVSSCAVVQETRKADNDYLMEELKIVPDKLAAEDNYVVDDPIDE